MSLMEKASDALSQLLLKDNQPCNYKLLSRKLDIHVSDAKKLLYSFYTQHKDELEATYVIVGQLRDSKEQLTIKVTTDLDDQSNFDEIQSIQVYALSAKEIKPDEIAHICASEVEQFPVSEEKMAIWGIIKGPDFTAVERPAAEAKSETSSRSGTSDSQAKSGQTSIMDMGKKKKEAEKKDKKDNFPDMRSETEKLREKYAKAEPPKKKETQQTIGRAFTKPSTTKAKQDTRRVKTEPTPQVEVIEDDDLEDDEYVKRQKKMKEEKDQRQKELESMFDDDDLVVDLSDAEEGQTEQPKTEKDPEQGDDVEVLSVQASPKKESPKKASPKKAAPKKAKKAEEVIEMEKEQPESYYDEDGYLVTTAVKSKSKPKVAPKAAPKPKSAAPADTPKANARTSSPAAPAPAPKKQKTAAKGQSSLMSFFGKKK